MSHLNYASEVILAQIMLVSNEDMPTTRNSEPVCCGEPWQWMRTGTLIALVGFAAVSRVVLFRFT